MKLKLPSKGMEGDRYLGFFISDDSTGRGLAAGILNYCEERGIDLSQLKVVGCDGTIVNTGYKVILKII